MLVSKILFSSQGMAFSEHGNIKERHYIGIQFAFMLLMLKDQNTVRLTTGLVSKTVKLFGAMCALVLIRMMGNLETTCENLSSRDIT